MNRLNPYAPPTEPATDRGDLKAAEKNLARRRVVASAIGIGGIGIGAMYYQSWLLIIAALSISWWGLSKLESE